MCIGDIMKEYLDVAKRILDEKYLVMKDVENGEKFVRNVSKLFSSLGYRVCVVVPSGGLKRIFKDLEENGIDVVFKEWEILGNRYDLVILYGKNLEIRMELLKRISDMVMVLEFDSDQVEKCKEKIDDEKFGVLKKCFEVMGKLLEEMHVEMLVCDDRERLMVTKCILSMFSVLGFDVCLIVPDDGMKVLFEEIVEDYGVEVFSDKLTFLGRKFDLIVMYGDNPGFDSEDLKAHGRMSLVLMDRITVTCNIGLSVR